MTTAADLAKIGCAPTISASVGRAGRNRPIDVAIVQHLLSVHYRGNSLVDILPPNGVADADLEGLLEDYQRDVQKMAKPDANAGASGTTIRLLRAKAGTAWVPYVFAGGANVAVWTRIDTERFVSLVQRQFGALDQAAQDGIRFLVRRMIADDQLWDLRWAAYMFATIKAETGKYQPIEEYKSLWSKSTGKGEYAEEITPADPAGTAYKGADGKPLKHRYYGRGYVQLTWLKNYRELGAAIGEGEALVTAPERALEPDIAYRIASLGMREGRFAQDAKGPMSLSRFINSEKCDYRLARQIINGLDRADEIAGYAIAFECLLVLSARE
jgi:hypothetical protein